MVVQPESSGLGPLSSLRERLAGRPSGQQGELAGAEPEVVRAHIARDLVDVVWFQKGQPGTIEREGTSCSGIVLDCANEREPRAFEAEIKTSDAGESRQTEELPIGNAVAPAVRQCLLPGPAPLLDSTMLGAGSREQDTMSLELSP